MQLPFKKVGPFFKEGLATLKHQPTGQISAFDGLRSFAVLLVVIGHGAERFLAEGGKASSASDFILVRGGWIGVDLFFILSGFFIGKLLWTEFRSSGTIDFKKFFLRRGLRIWPLYFAILALSILYRWLTSTPFTDLKPELLFYSNYVTGSYIGGSWSLATEEQFYIAVPLIIIVVGMFTRSLRAFMYGLLALFALEPVVRAITWAMLHPTAANQSQLVVSQLYFKIHTHCDGLLAGLILSNVICDKTSAKPLPMRYPRLLLLFSLIAAVLLRKLSSVYFGYFGVALIFASLAWYCLAVPNNLVARFLSWRGFFLIARLSYGMYLMHQPVSVPVSRFLINTFPSLPGAAMFGIVISATILASMLAATLGYLLVEQPFMRLRSRLESLAHRPQPATEMALAQVTGNR